MTVKKTPAKKTGPTIPAGAKKPQDHKPKAVKNEADGVAEFSTVQRGVEITIPLDQADWSIEAIEHFAEGNTPLAIRALIGTDKWAELKAAGAVGRDLNELGEKFTEEIGVDQGN